MRRLMSFVGKVLIQSQDGVFFFFFPSSAQGGCDELWAEYQDGWMTVRKSNRGGEEEGKRRRWGGNKRREGIDGSIRFRRRERWVEGEGEGEKRAMEPTENREGGEKKIQQHSSLSPSCPCHQSPGWQLPYSLTHTHTHTHTHTRHSARLPAYAADSPSDESWRGMAWHSTAFVRGAVFLLYWQPV